LSTVDIPNASRTQEKIERFEFALFEDEDEIAEWEQEDDDFEEDEDEEEFDEEEDYEDDEEEDFDEVEYLEDFDEEEYEVEDEDVFDEEDHEYELEGEKFDEEEDEDEDDDWTPEEYEQMDMLYEKYVREIARKYGDDWEEDYELDVDVEELYEAYLAFEERKQESQVHLASPNANAERYLVVEQKQVQVRSPRAERYIETQARKQEESRASEERRLLTQASHMILAAQQEESEYVETTSYNYDNLDTDQNRTDAQASSESHSGESLEWDLPSRRHMLVVNTGVSYYNYNKNKDKNYQTNNGQECAAPITIITTRRGNTQSVIGSI